MHPIIKTKDKTFNSFRSLGRAVRSGANVTTRPSEGTYSFTTNTGKKGTVEVKVVSSYATKTKKHQTGKKRAGGGRIANGNSGMNVKLTIKYENI